jgi:hypothetical protein
MRKGYFYFFVFVQLFIIPTPILLSQPLVRTSSEAITSLQNQNTYSFSNILDIQGDFKTSDQLFTVDPLQYKSNDLKADFKSLELNFIEKRVPDEVIHGYIWGALCGIGIGTFVGYSNGDDPQRQYFRITRRHKAIIGGILGAPLGAYAGGIVGALTHFAKVKIKISRSARQEEKERLNRGVIF